MLWILWHGSCSIIIRKACAVARFILEVVMKVKVIAILLCLIAACLFAAEGTHKFIGASGCKTCHKGVAQGNQWEIWEQSKHAKAYETLKSDAAAKIAKEKGLSKPAFESDECLKCHTTGFGAPPEMLDAKFDKTMGVQCEACHGAGFDYKGMTTMKDHQVALNSGLNPIHVSDGTAEKLCQTCHNSESPTFKSFDFSEHWEKIQHLRLKK